MRSLSKKAALFSASLTWGSTSSTKWLSQRWLFVVSRWPTVRNALLGVKLANEPFANKGPTVVRSFAALSESCLDMLQIKEASTSTISQPFANPTIPYPTIYQRFPTNCQQSALLGESSVALQKRRVPMDGDPWHGYHHSWSEFFCWLCALCSKPLNSNKKVTRGHRSFGKESPVK